MNNSNQTNNVLKQGTIIEIRQYADYIGIVLPEQQYMLQLAIEGVKAQLPQNWQACQTLDGEIVYRNKETKIIQEQHPQDENYRRKVIQLRQEYNKYLRENGQQDYGQGSQRSNNQLNTIPQQRSQRSYQQKQKSIQNLSSNRFITGPGIDNSLDNDILNLDQLIPSQQLFKPANTLKQESMNLLNCGVLGSSGYLNSSRDIQEAGCKYGINIDNDSKSKTHNVNVTNLYSRNNSNSVSNSSSILGSNIAKPNKNIKNNMINDNTDNIMNPNRQIQKAVLPSVPSYVSQFKLSDNPKLPHYQPHSQEVSKNREKYINKQLRQTNIDKLGDGRVNIKDKTSYTAMGQQSKINTNQQHRVRRNEQIQMYKQKQKVKIDLKVNILDKRPNNHNQEQKNKQHIKHRSKEEVLRQIQQLRQQQKLAKQLLDQLMLGNEQKLRKLKSILAVGNNSHRRKHKNRKQKNKEVIQKDVTVENGGNYIDACINASQNTINNANNSSKSRQIKPKSRY